MDNNEIASKIIAVRNELEKLQVRGLNNMKIVLACMSYLEGIAKAIVEPATDEE